MVIITVLIVVCKTMGAAKVRLQWNQRATRNMKIVSPQPNTRSQKMSTGDYSLKEKRKFRKGPGPFEIKNPPYDPVLEFRNKVIKMRYAQSEYAVKGTKESLRKAIEAENVIDETVFYPDGRLFDVNNDIRVDHAKKTGGNLWS